MRKKISPARRGDALRQHILWSAKEVFLELGFERTSMDLVAARAKTSKRSLYSHFESKEKLFDAFLELRRGLFLGNLKTPGDYSKKPAQALVLFCSQYLNILLFEASILLCRVSLAETARFPSGSAQYFDVVFTQVEALLSDYLRTTVGLTPRASAQAAQKLLGQLLYPRFFRALFGLDQLAPHYDPNGAASDFDLKSIRKVVNDLIKPESKY